MKFTVLHSVWGADGEEFAGGTHEVVKPTAAFLRLVAGAEAAGVLEVEASDAERKKLDPHVQSQEDGEKANEAARVSGEWHGAQYDQFLNDVEAGTRDPAPLPDRETFVAERKGG